MADLYRYNKFVADTASGATVASATVKFYDQDTGTAKAVYSDAAGNTSLGSETTTNANGFFGVFMKPGRYRITAEKGGLFVEWEHEFAPRPEEVTYEAKIGLSQASTLDVSEYEYVTFPYGNTPGDHAGGKFWVDKSDTTSTVDGGITVVDKNNSYRIKRVIEKNTYSLDWYMPTDATIAESIVAIKNAAPEGAKIVARSGSYACSNGPIILDKDDQDWDLNITIDFATSGASTDAIDLRNCSGVKLKIKDVVNSRRYGINTRDTTSKCLVHHTHCTSPTYTSFFNSGVDNTFYKCTDSDAGWDLASNYLSVRARWIECVSTRPKRHGFSTDSGTEDAQFLHCIVIDNGGYLNEGSDAFHYEGPTSYYQRQIGQMVGCIAKYTDSHIVLTDPTYIELVRAFRSENCYRVDVDGLKVIAEPTIQTALEDKTVVLFGDSRTDQSTIMPSTMVSGLILDFGRVGVGSQNVTLNNPKGGFTVQKTGYSGRITINEPDLNATANSENFGKTLVTTVSGYQNRNVYIYGGKISQYGRLFERVCRDVECTAELSNIANPFDLSAADSANASFKNERVRISGKCSDVSGVFLKEGYNDEADGIVVDGATFSGTINQLREGNYSVSTWRNCDTSDATVTTIEGGAGGLLNLNANAKSPNDAKHLTYWQTPVGNLTPHSYGSTVWVTGGTSADKMFVANGITSADWKQIN